jgi:hypothetical protein
MYSIVMKTDLDLFGRLSLRKVIFNRCVLSVLTNVIIIVFRIKLWE